MREVGRPVTILEIVKKLPRSTAKLVAGHIYRAYKDGLIEQHGSSRPYAYAVKAGVTETEALYHAPAAALWPKG